MTAQKGKDLLIKIADGAGFTTVAGLRTRRWPDGFFVPARWRDYCICAA